MPFDFAPNAQFDLPRKARQQRGLVNYYDGLAAEDAVAHLYEENGLTVAARRWRGQAGEIDLVCRGQDGFVFVEVKKSRNFDAAAAHLSSAQLHRIALAATEYIGTVADDPLSPMRLDLARVGANGAIDVLENLTLY